MRHKLSQAVCLLIMSHGLMTYANAQVDHIEEVVSTASRSEKPLSTQGGNLILMPGAEASFVKASHFAELSVRLAGVNFARNDGQEYLASIRSPIFTGAGACGAFLMAQDGIPLRSAGFCNVNELFEAFTEQAARIEIFKGPGPVVYGSNALHGMINVITPPVAEDGGAGGLELGSYEFIRFNMTKSVKDARHGLRASAAISHDGGARDDSGYDQQKIALRHEFYGDDWTATSSLTLTNLDQETAGFIRGKDAYKDRDIAKSNPNPEAFRKARSLRFWSQFSTEIADDVRWQFTPYLRLLDMEFLMHFLPGQPLEENSQNSVGLQNGFYFNEGGDLEIIAGADFEYTQAALKQTQDNPTAGSAFLRATIPAGKQYDYDVDSIMAAAFLQADMKVGAKIHVLLGARIEYMQYDYINNMLPGRVRADGSTCGFGGCRYSRPMSRKDDFAALSPKLGLLYHYQEGHSIYFNLGRGYRAPQATELYRLQRAQEVADLGEVSLQNIELGFRGQEKNVTYNLSFYAMKKNNYIFRDTDFFNVNGGKSDHIGADMMIKIDVNDHFQIRANGSLARHRYAFDYVSNGVNLNGNDIDSAPRHFGSMQLVWRPTERIKAELAWVHMGSYYLEPENQYKYEGHDYLNFRAEFQMTEKYSFSLRLMNVTNRLYAERADYTSFTDERYFPGKPRSLFVGVKGYF